MDEERKKRRFPWAVLVGLLLLVAYPLSIGPARWLHDRGHLGADDGIVMRATLAFYRPYAWLQDNSETARILDHAYMKLWTPSPRTPTTPPP